MALQAGVTTDVVLKVESTWGVDPGATAARYLRRISSGLTLSKDTYSSNEVRRDLQVADLRHGVRRVAGPINGELNIGDYDDLIEAAMGGTWTVGGTGSNTQLTSVAGNGGTRVLTFAAGSLYTQGFDVGDVVRFTGVANLPITAQYRIAALTATTMTLTESFTTFSAITTFTVAAAGKKLLNGTVKRSFTVEHRFEDIVQYQRFNGCRVNAMSLSLPPTGLATCNFDMMGKDATTMSGTPYFTTPTAAGTGNLFAAVNGNLSIAGTDVAVITGFDINVARGISGDPVVGSNTIPEMFYGRTVITGTLTAFLQDNVLVNSFINESINEISVTLTAPTTTVPDFLSFHMHRVKFTGADLPVSGEAGMPISIPFQALLQTGGGVTGYDTSSLVIQRSNP